MINKKIPLTTLTCFLLFTSVNILSADALVKSVDEAGNVTYSDKPVPEAKTVTKVPVHAGPSDSEIDAAKQQAEKNITAAEKIDRQNAAALKKQKHINTPAEASKQGQGEIIISGANRRPLNGVTIPHPSRPGINPPPTKRPIAGPKANAGGGRR